MSKKFSITVTDYFLRRSRKFFKKHPDLRPKFGRVIEDIQQDPTQPHLNLHPLQGKLTGLYSISLNYSFRITLTFKMTEHEIILIDIGSHDEVYR